MPTSLFRTIIFPAGFTALAASCLAHPQAPVSGPTPPAPQGLRSELVTTGDLSSRLVSDDADLVIFYAGEHRGSMEDCGCSSEKHGGLPRLQGYLDAAVQASPSTPALLLYTGFWLNNAVGMDQTLREDASLENRWMARAMQTMGWSAINVGFDDIPGIEDLGARVATLPILSANVAPLGDAPAPARWMLFNLGDLRVGVLGITGSGPTFLTPRRYALEPARAAAEETLALHQGEADLVVLLAYQAIDQARELALTHPEIDLVIEAFKHRDTEAPFPVGGALWVKSNHQTRLLGELRLWLHDGRIDAALDRKIDIDPDLPADPPLEGMRVRAARELRDLDRRFQGP